jgi:hypothetical protein
VSFKLVLDRGIMEVEPAIQTKSPANVRARSLMYPSADGRLSRNDTRQGTLALAESQDVSTAEVRDIRSMQTPA